ncbi:hypothetical protein SLH46_17925 [Draconibacterium sp. IB214405]|uniref:hypothetical protein n=1 Tax=Draconibacterium sp. IB214405 TaxID=3097352 RepID=UPI002A0C6EC7|nr:hypothetical protein [Draconibacterium sp. IB214405]MDX8341082.1 hypothetical protein [Draconibacterium sp. IB214405]
MKASKRNNRREFINTIKRNNLMTRFIREIEREEPLEQESLQTMLVYQPIRVR